MARHRDLQVLSDIAVTEALARTPLDHYVIWDGRPCGAQTGSLRSRALAFVDEPWRPMQLRALIQRAARVSGALGFNPDTVRGALRMHQSARPAAYLLVRRTVMGDFAAVADIPWPASAGRPIRAGELVLDRRGRRFPEALAA